MISGYFVSQQDFVDLVNGYLSNKEGILGIYLEGKSIELYIEKGYIKGFYVEMEDLVDSEANTLSLLIYSLFNMLDNPNALFAFKTGVERDNFLKLHEPISAEELILQLQLAYQEFKSLLTLIITPFATLRVLKPFDGMHHYDGKTVISAILTSKNTLVSEIRKLEELLRSGFLDIGQFITPEVNKKAFEINYIVKNVSLTNINVFSIFESLKLSKFTGWISISKANGSYNAYFKRGKFLALYPYSPDFFGFLLSTRKDYTISIVSMSENLLENFMLRHSTKKLINNLSDDFVELGKIFLGIIRKGFSGLLTLQRGNERMHFVCKNGVLLASLLDRDGIEISKMEPYKESFLLELVPFEPMENFWEVLHLLLINTVYSIILRHSSQAIQSILYYLASSDLFKVVEGSVYFRTDPKGRKEEILGFLSFLLDVGYKILGREKLEEELENSLHPYKEIFKILDLEDYTKLWSEIVIDS